MYKKTLISLAVASSLLVTGCYEDSRSDKNAGTTLNITNPGFDGRTWPQFEAVKGELPVPTDLQFSGTTDGTMNAGTDPGNPVVTGIDSLDGNSVTAQFDIKFSGGLDENQDLDARPFVRLDPSDPATTIPNPNQNVFLLPLEYPSTDPLVSASGEVPSFAEAISFQIAAGLRAQGQAATTAAADAIVTDLTAPAARAEIISLDGGTDNVLRISPLEPLRPKTKYLVVLTDDIKDKDGQAIIGSPTYQNASDPDAPLAGPLQPLRGAILNWETLARGYFGFMETVFGSQNLAALGLDAPTGDDIAFSVTFTTTAVDDVLAANAAPRTFFESKGKVDARKQAIESLVEGDYNLTEQPVSGDATDQAVNNRIFALLTDPNIVPRFKLFNPDLAAKLVDLRNAGVTLTYDAFAGVGEDRDATKAFVVQTAASRAAIDIKGGAIATGAVDNAEANLVGGGAIDATSSRPSNFYAFNSHPLAPNAAFLAQGEIKLSYNLAVPTNDGSVIRTSRWNANDLVPGAPSDKVTYRFPFAKKTTDVTVPVIATVPNENVAGQQPANGWPVIIFQHGITTDRSASLPLATALATICASTSLDCFATVAIDQPLHGVTPDGSTVPVLQMVKDLSGNTPSGASPSITERHFNFTADAQNNAAPMIGDADFDQSGSLFINLSNFANSRDILRQGVLDMLNLNASLAAMEIDPDNDPGTDNSITFDPNRVYFVGHSLGGVNGVPFVAVNNMVAGAGVNSALPSIQGAAFLNTGGGITKLLENSPAFAPDILQGLAAASSELEQGRSGLETYFRVLQGLLDSTDPVNFAKSLGSSSTDVLLTEIIGDAVVPNAADSDLFAQGPLQLTLANGFTINSLPAPLAGTEPMAAQFGASKTADGTLPAISRFIAGSHSNPVSNEPQAVFDEMVFQIGQLFTPAATVQVNDSTVIEP